MGGFEPGELFDERAGHSRIGGAAAYAGDVIDNEHFGVYEVDLIFNSVEQKPVVILPIAGQLCIGLKLGAVEMFGKIMIARSAGIARPELPGAKLEVDIEHIAWSRVDGESVDFAAAGNTFGNLHGQYGFAGIGIGKKDTEFVLVPEFAEKHFSFSFAFAQLHPAVAGGYMEKRVEIFWVGRRGGLFFLFDGPVELAAEFGAELFDVRRAFGSVVFGHEGMSWG
jgi:hypothetical protein